MTVLTTESGQEDILLTPKEVSDVLRVPVGTLGQWRHRGTGPRSIKYESGGIRYRRSIVLAWLAEQELNSTD
ncbi:helix-turn-helix transcriptional regulator [Actinacidiphila reveromycinica]|nr:helix-turn-helix domain-containing protein [Streptomyces sp. SN-593]